MKPGNPYEAPSDVDGERRAQEITTRERLFREMLVLAGVVFVLMLLPFVVLLAIGQF